MKNGHKFLMAIIMGIFISFLISSCTNPVTLPDGSELGEVSNLVLTPGNGQVVVSWTNPSDTDLDHVEIHYGIGTAGNLFTGVYNPAGTVVTPLINDIIYTFLVQTVDKEGNLSAGLSGLIAPGNSSSTPANPDLPVITLLGAPVIRLEERTPYTEPGYIAVDKEGHDISSSVTIVGTVNVTIPGTYSLSYFVSDALGNWAIPVTRTIEIYRDATSPVLTLLGDNPYIMSSGETFMEPGATALDNIDGDISSLVVIGGDVVDSGTPGTYTVTYDIADSAGNSAPTLSRSVIVNDISLPVITLNGGNTVYVEAGDVYIEAGATAIDAIDGDLSSDIEIGGDTVDITTLGTYILTYNVTDKSGNSAVEGTRTVIVRDTISPILSLSGNSTVYIEQGTSYIEPGAMASDSFEGDISQEISIGGDTVNALIRGTYTITYNVSDSSGNEAAEVLRTVIVRDTTEPIISLTSSTSLSVEAGHPYSVPDYSATDNIDGDLTDEVILSGSVDTATPGIYELYLNVSDSAENQADQVTITVTVTPNRAPTADAGIDRTISPGQFYLNGSNSSDQSDDLTYEWECLTSVDGFSYTLNTPESAITYGTISCAPVGDYVFRLTVSDGINEVSDTVTLSIRNVAPFFDLNLTPLPSTIPIDTPVFLNISYEDLNMDDCTVLWEITSRPDGSTSVIDFPEDPQTAFSPDAAGEYTLSVTVSDGELSTTGFIYITAVGEGQGGIDVTID
ncbi:MAG: DUF5011 domain-containing protein [Spirochaetales bacterium]|nr:DUF5011 domain-containing protein [Spirochaetales bacterium]